MLIVILCCVFVFVAVLSCSFCVTLDVCFAAGFVCLFVVSFLFVIIRCVFVFAVVVP